MFSKAFKFYLRYSTIKPGIFFITGVMFLFGTALVLLSAILGEPYGAEEYLLSISACSMALNFTFFGFILYNSCINSKHFHSTPYAETVCTKVIPVLSFILNTYIVLLSVISTAISLSNGTTTGNRMSDLLLCLALCTALANIGSGVFLKPVLALIFYELNLLPFMLITLTSESSIGFISDLQLFGFGVPLNISIVIFAVVYIGTFMLSFPLAKATYKKRPVKTMVNYSTTGTAQAIN